MLDRKNHFWATTMTMTPPSASSCPTLVEAVEEEPPTYASCSFERFSWKVIADVGSCICCLHRPPPPPLPPPSFSCLQINCYTFGTLDDGSCSTASTLTVKPSHKKGFLRPRQKVRRSRGRGCVELFFCFVCVLSPIDTVSHE